MSNLLIIRKYECRMIKITTKPCLDCGDDFLPRITPQQMFCETCGIKRSKQSRFESNKRCRMRRAGGDVLELNSKSRAGTCVSWEVISCPDNDWPIGARLDKLSTKLSLAAGYMPVGMRLRDLQVGYDVIVHQSNDVRQSLIRVQEDKLKH